MLADHASAKLRVVFAGEAGQDAGGVTREWFDQLGAALSSAAATDPAAGHGPLVTADDGATLLPRALQRRPDAAEDNDDDDDDDGDDDDDDDETDDDEYDDDELAELRRTFDAIDADGSGSIDAPELRGALASAGVGRGGGGGDESADDEVAALLREVHTTNMRFESFEFTEKHSFLFV